MSTRGPAPTAGVAKKVGAGVLGGLLLIVGIWWAVRAKHTFTGPVRTVEFDEGTGVSD